MAIQDANFGMQNTRGRVGNVVYKNYSGKTVISVVADMSQVVKSGKQQRENRVFARAVAFAKKAKADPGYFTAPDFVQKPGQSLFHAAISWYCSQDAEPRHLSL